jgi:hypothetical protein
MFLNSAVSRSRFMRTLAASAITSSLAWSASPAAATADDLQQFNVDFERGATLKGWHELKVAGWAPKWQVPQIAGGRLVLRPYSSIWFEDLYGGFIYRQISGDFIMTARVRVSGRNAGIPRHIDSTAGLFVREPRPVDARHWMRGHENWLFFFTGSADMPGRPQFETKTTANSVSTLKTFPGVDGWMDLRLAREGEVFTMLYRPYGATWQLLDEFIRPDLPATLQVGLAGHTNWEAVSKIYPDYERYNKYGVSNGTPDVVMEVRSVTFRRPLRDRAPHLASMHPMRWSDYIRD